MIRTALLPVLLVISGAVNAQEAAPSVVGTPPPQPVFSELGAVAQPQTAGAPLAGEDAPVLAAPGAALSATAEATGLTNTDITADTTAVAPSVDAPLADSAEPVVHTDLWTIVISSHWVVLTVMIGLALAAFMALVIWIQKTVEYTLAFRAMRRTAKVLAKAETLDEAEAKIISHKGPAAAMIRAASQELNLAIKEPALQAGVRERTNATLSRIEAGVSQRLRVGTGALASIGSLAPFVGLFGTVFGIMNSFLAIAESKTTNLAVVAPGIAEALFATAIGLAAAIPAVLIYNVCARKLAKFRHQLVDIATAAERLQSRSLDRLAAQTGA